MEQSLPLRQGRLQMRIICGLEFKIDPCTTRAISNLVRDGPFDIQGEGWDFSSRQVIFFSVFAQQVIFFKSKLQQVFYFFEKTHSNQKNVNESNTLNEKVQKP